MKASRSILTLMSLLLIASCGNTSESQEASATVFSKFITAKDGVQIKQDLQYQGHMQFSAMSSSVPQNGNTGVNGRLRIDQNGSYFLYFTSGQASVGGNNDLNQYQNLEGISGYWTIEDDKLKLDGIGATLDYKVVNPNYAGTTNNYYAYNNQPNMNLQQHLNETCLSIITDRSVNVEINQPSYYGYGYGVNQGTSNMNSTIPTNNAVRFCNSSF